MAGNFGIAEGIRALKPSNQTHQKNTLTNSVVDRFLKIEEETRIKNESETKKIVSNKKSRGEKKHSDLYPMLSFRCSPEMKEMFKRMDGRGLGTKIMNLISKKESYEEILKEQVAPLKSLAIQFGHITDKHLNLNEVDREKIVSIAKHFNMVSNLIKYSNAVHGQFLTDEEKERIDKILRLNRMISSEH